MNAGRPATDPPESWWAPDPAGAATGLSGSPPPWGPPTGPRYADPDPAVAEAPPWPVLVAGPGYRPPRLIKWPIVVGVLALVVYVLAIVAAAAAGGGTASSQHSWLASHDGTMQTLKSDQAALQQETADQASTQTVLAGWGRLHQDAVTASAATRFNGAMGLSTD